MMRTRTKRTKKTTAPTHRRSCASRTRTKQDAFNSHAFTINPQGMIWISGGTFRMGSDHRYPEEAPAH
jgi:formylglycine-generating enzyme required for sulfatase activity